MTTPLSHWRTFYHLIANNLIAGIANNFVWFALTFWVFLQTNSVLATSWIAGIFTVANMLGGFIFGPMVDHLRKRTAMILSSGISLTAFSLGGTLFFLTPPEIWSNPASVQLWLLVIVLMIGVVANNLRMIAQSTVVTLLFTDDRDKANGLIGATQGLSFSATSVLSGLAIGFLGMGFALIGAITVTTLVAIHLITIALPEPTIIHVSTEQKSKVDFRGTFLLITAIPGLVGIIIFNTFNNFLGGIFMALMDAYGLSLVSVKAWGLLWGVLSLSIVLGSIYVSKYGVGQRPLRLVMILNIIMWVSCIIFPLQASVYLLAAGMLVWLSFFPVIEAAEQTIMQKVVPYERQGRVFGLAQSIESMATPVTAFLIGPIAQWLFIPFMTTGAGVVLIGDWFGTGTSRGIALVFITAGFFGLIATIIAWSSGAYRRLAAYYTDPVQLLKN